MCEEKLEELLKKPFNILTAEEKEYVLRFLNREQFDHAHLFLHKVVQSIADDKRKLRPSKFIQENLSAAFRSKYQNPSQVLISTNIKSLLIPAAVAVICLVFIRYNMELFSPLEKVKVQTVKSKNAASVIHSSKIADTQVASIDLQASVKEKKIRVPVEYKRNVVKQIIRDSIEAIANDKDLCLTIDIHPPGAMENIEENNIPGSLESYFDENSGIHAMP